MAHPFKDKLVVFMGTPVRCKRQAARDALVAVGGVPDENVSAFTNFVVAFSGADKTKAYKKAERYSHGLLTILTEDQFFDILDRKATPPEQQDMDGDITVTASVNAEAEAAEREKFASEHLTRKKINSMARDGVQTPEGRVKVDMRPLEKMNRVAKALRNDDEAE